jgi:hypothetical protein
MTDQLSVVKSHRSGKTTYEIVTLHCSRALQTRYEIGRDLIELMDRMQVDESVHVRIHQDPNGLWNWECDGACMPLGDAKTANAIEQAHEPLTSIQAGIFILSMIAAGAAITLSLQVILRNVW